MLAERLTESEGVERVRTHIENAVLAHLPFSSDCQLEYKTETSDGQLTRTGIRYKRRRQRCTIGPH